MRATFIAVGFLLLAGCAHYEFDIVQPPEVARHVGRSAKTAAAFSLDNVDYRLRAYEGYLVMSIGNPGDTPLEILGAQSYVVDPDNQSHPIPSQTVGSKSFVRMIFPPLRPYFPVPGYVWAGPYLYYYPEYYPTYVVVPNVPPGFFWEWEGQTSVTIHLTYRRGQQTVSHQFVVARVKVK